jgi:hypothetical protein
MDSTRRRLDARIYTDLKRMFLNFHGNAYVGGDPAEALKGDRRRSG